MKKYFIFLFFFYSFSVYANEWSGKVSLEYSQFNENGLSAAQFKQYGSIAIQPEWFHEWDGGKQVLSFVPFYRWDQRDQERTHFDIRELSWLKVYDESELRVGLRKVFWGVTESQHLVDIINQTDLVESVDGEEKLGQPMINYALINDWGTLDLYILPYFRERTFAGVNGRLRTIPRIDTTNPIYESSDKEKHIDTAVRWSHSIGDWDIGLSYFSGTSRAPLFVSALDSNASSVFRPVYNLISQTGLDLQATIDAWLWKLEVIDHKEKSNDYIAATFGYEYTFYGVFDSSSDIGLVMEYLYDDRNQNALTPFEDDVMLGLRWTNNDENDTTLLFGVIADRSDSSRLYSLEASRRIAESWTLDIEARVFSGIKASDTFLFPLRQDDFIKAELNYYF